MKPFAAMVTGALISLAMSAPAYAHQWNEDYSVRVVYGDLNLDSDTGADTFINRLDNAGELTCGRRTGPTSLRERQTSRRCATSFTQRGVVRVNHPNVNARYIARGGQLPTIDVASM